MARDRNYVLASTASRHELLFSYVTKSSAALLLCQEQEGLLLPSLPGSQTYMDQRCPSQASLGT